ncbi:DUF2397 family protein [Nocardiopsis sp. NPDC057823]|uniref:DUF2397 family protein n=1 Tax=Nocardiopsis sp. NPDC057823 TaxID=3346256 RepID=UPI00366D1B8F
MGLNQWADDRADDERSGGERPAPRHGRAALLRLASWFEDAGPERADALAAAAYALYPARHLRGRVDEGVAATTGWWQAEPDRSTVTERPGTRPPEPVRDHRAQQARLRDAAESSAHWRRAGAAQVRALLARPTGPRARLDLSGAGMEVLMELLTAALGSGDAGRGPTAAGDLEFALRLHVVSAPGYEVVVQGEGGELTLEGLRLCVTPYEQHEIPAGLLEPPAPPRPPNPPTPSVQPEPSEPTASSAPPAHPASPAPPVTSEPSAPFAQPVTPVHPGAPVPSGAPAPPAPSGNDTPTPPGGLPLAAPDDEAPTPPHGFPAVQGPRPGPDPDASVPPGGHPGAAGDPDAGEDPRPRTATPPGGIAVDPPTGALPVVRNDDDEDRGTGPAGPGRERPRTGTWG